MQVNFAVVTLPKMVEVKGKDWVYYGKNNDYPYYLVDLFNASAKNNAVITGKTQYICGQGLEFTPSGDVLADAKTQNFLMNANRFETMNDVFKKITTDFEISNGAYLKLVPNRAKNGFAEVYHIDFTKVRSNKNNSIFYVSDEWLTEYCSEEKPYGNINTRVEPITYPAWDFKSFDKEYIIYIKTYRPNLRTYTMPDYAGALTWIEIDKRIGNFHLNNLNNGFSASHIINFNNGEPEKDEQKEIEKKFKNKFTSEENAGKFVLTFSDDQTKAPTVITLTPSDLDKQFDLLNKTCMQEVMTGHKIVSPMLFGIKTEGQLGGRTELVEAYQLFTNGYVQHRRAVVLEIFNDVFKAMGLLPLHIENIKPIGLNFSETVIAANMTKDEIRKELGLPPLEVAVVQTQAKMSSVKDVSEEIKKAILESIVEDNNEVIGEFSVEDWDNVETIKAAHLEKYKFVDDSRTLRKAILETIQLNPSITLNELSKLVDTDKADVQKIIDKLVKEEYLKPLKKGQYEVTEKGTNYVVKILDIPKSEDTPLQQYELYTVWQYRVRPDVPNAKDSRDLCKELMSATAGNKVLTEDKIQSLSEKYYGNAWELMTFKGGWYTNPETKEHTPFCRHEWKAVIKKRVIKK